MKSTSTLGLALIAFSVAATTAAAAMSPAQKTVIDQLFAAATAADSGFKGFSADRGKAFFHAAHGGGKPDTPSCTSCHTTNLAKPGMTRAGKEIAPMAASVNAKRYSDPADVEKWFKRNCKDVLGRECTAVEKGDVLIYLLGQ